MPEHETPARSDPRRILVVDDDPVVREMLVRVLLGVGYETFPAANGRQAEQAWDAVDFDLVLLDLAMAEQDGWATLARLRQKDPDAKAIIITAWPHQEAAARGAGAVGCFEKPLDFTELLAAIARQFAPPGSAAWPDLPPHRFPSGRAGGNPHPSPNRN